MTGGPLTGVRLSLRIAAREAWRNRVQSFLVAALVLVPVAATTAILTISESGVPTREETAAIWLGASAEASLEVVSPPDESLTQDALTPDDWQIATDAAGDRLHSDPHAEGWVNPADVLPRGTRILPIAESFAGIVADTATGQGRLVYVEGEVWDTSLDGAYRLTSGRAPSAAGEVLVTGSALDRLGLALGDSFTVREPADTTLTVVGTIVDATRSDAVDAVYAPPGTVPEATAQLASQRYVLPDLALSWPEVQELNTQGIVALSRAVLSDPPEGSYRQLYDPRSESFGLAIGVGLFAAFGIVVLAGAAFTIGARRRQRSLALIASIGGSRGALFRIVAADGLVHGALGAVVGILAGIGAAFIWLQVNDDGDRLAYPGFHLSAWGLLLVGTVAILVAGIAAVIPAGAASRVDALEALRTVDRPPERPRRTHLVGIPLSVLGVAAVIVIGVVFSTTPLARGQASPGATTDIVFLIFGAVLATIAAIIGAALTVPLLLRAIARPLGNSPLPVRLAAHDMATDTRRASPIVAVILVMVAIATIAVSTASYVAQGIRSTAVIEALPGRLAIALVGPNTTEQTPEAAARVADEALATVNRLFDVAEARVLQRPAQDWTTFFDASTTSSTYIRALPATDALCPLSDGTAVSGATDYEQALNDTRCGPDALALRVLFAGYGATTPSILIGEAEDLEFVTDTRLTSPQRAFLEGGGAMAFWPQLVADDGTVSVVTQSFENGSFDTQESTTLPAQVFADSKRLWHHIFITPQTAESIGLTPADAHLLVTLNAAPTQAQLDAAWAELNTLVPGISNVALVRDPMAEPQRATATTLVLAFGMALAAGLLALGLGWVESRRDRRTLWTLGASPGTIRLTQAGQVWLLTTVAALLGTVIGLLPVVAVLAGTDTGITPPWTAIAATVIGFPLTLALIAALLPIDSSAARIRRGSNTTGQLADAAGI